MAEPSRAGVLQDFLERYPPRPYHRRNDEYPRTELQPVGAADGLWYLNEVPVTPLPTGSPRRSHEEDGENCHLWVIDERGRPCIAETPLARLGGSKPHHTNLTGGGTASIGGEIWFGEMPRVYVSGSSGRYPPMHQRHLEEAERVFAAVGFEVLSLGWDQEIDKPQRVWRGQTPTVDE